LVSKAGLFPAVSQELNLIGDQDDGKLYSEAGISRVTRNEATIKKLGLLLEENCTDDFKGKLLSVALDHFHMLKMLSRQATQALSSLSTEDSLKTVLRETVEQLTLTSAEKPRHFFSISEI
jgi:hypothetical protein